MPRIHDSILGSIIYLYASQDDAEKGQKTGGTGFLVQIWANNTPGAAFIYAVTNRHVVEEAGCCTIRLNAKDGVWDVIDTDPRDWILHPDGDDLAICELPHDDYGRHDVFVVGLEQFLTKQDIEAYNLGPGDETIEVGRFINHEGKERNLPSLRFGNISQMPWEPIRQQRGFGHFDQESFLVEARSVGGFSGSPVYVYMHPSFRRPMKEYEPDKEWNPAPGDDFQTWLLGVCWGHINDWLPVCDATGRPAESGYKVRSNSGMMAVVPAWKLQEMLFMPRLVDKRRKDEEDHAKKAGLPIATSDVASDLPDNDENPTHRADFMRLANAAARKQKPVE